MAEIKRDLVKYVRDKAKSAYEKDDHCAICNATEELELHHFKGLSALLRKWLAAKKITINTADDIMAVREDFIEEHYDDLYNKVVTLCKNHHAKLHSIYGKDPGLGTAAKQARWVARMREKHGLAN